MSDETISVMTLSMEGCGGYTVDKSTVDSVFDELKSAMDEGHDEEYTVRFHEMDKAEFEALPEFEGF